MGPDIPLWKKVVDLIFYADKLEPEPEYEEGDMDDDYHPH